MTYYKLRKSVFFNFTVPLSQKDVVNLAFSAASVEL